MKIPESIKLSSLVQKPRHRSKINWVFSSGLKFSVSAGVLGAVGVILVIKAKRFINFTPSDQDGVSSRFWAVPGLENLGNNCFLNVVLQALASCSSFRKYLGEMLEEYGSSSVEGDELIPLVNALTSLVEELCTVRHKRTVLSPRKLMLVMDHYIPNFNLTRQQDAEEAFSHLLSSLRDEISEYCVPVKSYLADLPALPNGRILITGSNEEENEWQRWSRSFLKPFDGVLGSILICRSCSFQISLDFQLFHSLHLSPPLSSDGTIRAGCTLEDCLKKFFVAELVENYCCSNCWHTAAIDYLSGLAEDKTDIEKLRQCNKNDSCECKTLSSLEAFPWSNRFCHTFKQLSIARSPKILCIHLQRASYNMFGQSVKLLGHVSFPLMLDLSSFMNTGVGLKSMEANSQSGLLSHSSRELRSFTYSKYQNMLLAPGMPSSKASRVESISSASEIVEKQERSATLVGNGPCLTASESGPSWLDSTRCADKHANFPSPPQRCQTYRLFSVVEHFGSSGGGHYTVYRKVTARLGDEDPVALLESTIEQWFCISDSEVHSVSEKDVLDANASMLFYEKID
ncbi:ubiquitin carboxyl-terminal hydrolase 27 [Sesamum indicum]|uniref:Ubiquitin carboxyl-terminal hydrolase n=1 Tax=Sesamum indicum TaxID=4182 RepID=A0A6I9UIC9_SESIN|nr:ubiquitin carboxyl-terminal hydrolase 27 [Sesamum indicum]